MTRLISKTILWSFLLIFTASVFAAPAQAQGEPGTTQTLKVYTKPIEPFVMKESDEGFSIDLLSALMNQLNLPYEIMRVQGVADVLDAVEQKKADLGIAAITINAAREEKVDFSQPMFESGLQIMTSIKHQKKGFSFSLLFPLFRIIGFLLLIMFVAANVLWLLEHNKNEQFRKDYFHGVWDAFWWSAVTVTTVGYGDKFPQTFLGRIIGITWMFSGLFLIAIFTSSITSTLTVQSLQGSINGPADLIGKNVGAIEKTTSADYLVSLGVTPVTYKTPSEMYDALDLNEVEAVVYDAPVLQYYVANAGAGKFQMVGKKFKLESYGIALPKGSPLTEDVNIALLQLRENGAYTALLEKWFGVSE